MNILITVLIVIGYFLIILAIVPIIFKTLFRMPQEVVRKFQHIGFASSIFIFTERCETWWHAVIVLIIFGTTIFFAVWGFEKTKLYNRFFVDRQKNGGEMKISLLMAMGVFIVLFILFGGILPQSNNDIIVVSVMSWGVGDALAALFGKYLGKRKLKAPGTDHNKTWLGSTVMAISVSIVVFIMLVFYQSNPWWSALISALIIAVIATTIEAYTKNGFDTLTIPFGVASILYGLQWFWFAVLGG